MFLRHPAEKSEDVFNMVGFRSPPPPVLNETGPCSNGSDQHETENSLMQMFLFTENLWFFSLGELKHHFITMYIF